MDALLPSLPAQDKKVKPMEAGILGSSSSSSCLDKKAIKLADQKEIPKALNCPRCNSSNTKFCYYNNYSQTQPRKNKRQSSSSFLLSNATKIKLPDLVEQQQQHSSINPNPKLSLFNHYSQDLNLGKSLHPPNNDPYDHHHQYKNANYFNANSYLSQMELVTGIGSQRGSVMASFMPMPMQMSNPNPNPVYPVGFSFQGDFRPSLGFSLDDFGRVDHNKAADHDNDDDHQDHIGDQVSTRDHDDEHQHGEFWSGNILGGAGSW
ncbi:hypothetical protein V2J09_014593 [Rumex salicifolius]